MTALLVVAIAAVLALPLLAFAMIFAVGCVCGVAAYHLSRQVVVAYQPMRKAFDPEKEKLKEKIIAAKASAEIAAIQTSYLGGLQLTRDQYVAAEGGR